MKFRDFKYERPDMDKIREEFKQLTESFAQAKTFEEQNDSLLRINALRDDFQTMYELVYIRHSVDTEDVFYEEENDFFDENLPLFKELENEYKKQLIDAKFRKELEEKWGSRIFDLAEVEKKAFHPQIIELLQKENKLSSEYVKLISSAKIFFDGKERNLSQMAPFMEDPNREKRRAAFLETSGFFEQNEEKFDEIFDGLVKVRDEIAKKLGFENFVEVGYARMSRTDYDAKDVANYRKQILNEIVPLAQGLRKRQQERLGLEKLYLYDESFEFESGNAKPKGEEAFLVDQAQRMYHELSPETGIFFDFMKEKELLDLTAKKGKTGGGYCTYIPNYQAPFIFSNFNGTSGDVDVLTHEAGHAFQAYESRHFELSELGNPTMETAEIHSMSMEFFAWPWMESFFGDQADKYRFSHLASALTFLPYGATVDEFQHWVYENPQAAPAERKAMWRQIERRYLPWRDYDGNAFMERGGFWFKQAHIFEDPFYYIDYTLAQVCALQFWVRSRADREDAWTDYLKLCQAGGSKSFVELLNFAGLKNPFASGSLETVIPEVQKYLDSVDDTKL